MASLASFRGPNAGAGGIGAAGIARAQAAGYSMQQIQQMARSEGLRIDTSGSAPAAAPAPAPPPAATPAVTLASFRGANAGAGGLGLAAVQRARQAGLSDSQIQQMAAKEGLTLSAETGLAAAGEAWPSHVQKSYVDAGSGATYQTRQVNNTAKGTVYVAGPMSGSAVRSFLAGEPESNWVLPASTAGPGEPYQGPSGTRYVSPISVDPARRINPSAYQQPAAAAAEQPSTPAPAQNYQQSFDSASASYQKTIDELNTKLKTAEADREAAANDARLYREEAIDTQLAGLRSGGSAGRGRIGSGTGALASGGGSYSASRSRSLVDVRAGLDATDSVLNRKTPVVTPLSSGRPANSAQAPRRSAASGSSAAGYYSRRFG